MINFKHLTFALLAAATLGTTVPAVAAEMMTKDDTVAHGAMTKDAMAMKNEKGTMMKKDAMTMDKDGAPMKKDAMSKDDGAGMMKKDMMNK